MKSLSPGTLILGIFAMLFGLAGAYAAKQYLTKAPPERPAPPKAETVPLAGADLPAGRTVTLGDVMLVKMTPAQMEKANLPPLMMMNPKQVIGRTVREPVKKGNAFTITSLYPEGTGPSVAETLKPGCRAVTVDLQGNSGDIAMVQPGTIVDVIFRANANKDEQIQEATMTLLEAVDVLAVNAQQLEGTVSRPDPNGAQRSFQVTLAVTPEQAKALKTVEGRGTISLAVRSQKDTRAAAVAQAQTLGDLLNLPKPEPPFVTQIYRGGRPTKMEFVNGEIKETPPPVIASLPVATVSGDSQTSAESTAGAVEDQGNDSKSSCRSCQRSARSIVKRGSQSKRLAGTP